MKKSILRVMVFAATVAALFVGCQDSASSNNKGFVDDFLFRVNQKPGTGGESEVSMRVVTVESEGSGKMGDGPQVVGTTVSINAGTVTDRPFLKWTTANPNVTFADSTGQLTSFIMPPDNVTVTAHFDPTLPVTVSGGTGATGGGRYLPGDTVKITAGTMEGRPFESWTTASNGVTFADSAKDSTSFIMPENGVTVAASFKGAHLVTVSGGGMNATETGYHYVGETVRIYAGTKSGYSFDKWTSQGVTFADPTKNSTSFTMPARAVTVTANFIPLPGTGTTLYNAVVSSVGEGVEGSSKYSENETVRIYAGTKSGYRFTTWTTEDGVTFAHADSARTTFTMPAKDVRVTAVFKELFTVTVLGGAGATGGGNYIAGETVNITAGTMVGRPFEKWTTTSNGVTLADSTKNTTSFTMPANAVTVTANFIPSCTVKVMGGAGAAGGGNHYFGETVNINAGTYPYGVSFKRWEGAYFSGDTALVDVVFADANNAATTFIVPDSFEVRIYALFEGMFTDGRDNQTYRAIAVGDMMWMAENLNYQTPDSSWCYDNADSNCVKYGRLYNWNVAKTACPAGWHLPSDEEWGTLIGSALRQSNCWKTTSGWDDRWDGESGNGTDYFGFSALPGGKGNGGNGSFSSAGYEGYWWTATNIPPSDGSSAVFLYASSCCDGISYNQPAYKSNGFSVRCVAD